MRCFPRMDAVAPSRRVFIKGNIVLFAIIVSFLFIFCYIRANVTVTEFMLD